MNAIARHVALTLAGAFPGPYRAMRSPLLRRAAVRGLPPGLDLETLDVACEGKTGEHVSEVAHTSLQSLKRSQGTGSFRVWVRTGSKDRWSVIYKREPPVAGEGEGAGRRRSLGEVALYMQPSDELAPFLPGVYWFETPADEMGGYRYLIEDLWATHRRARSRSDLEGVAARLGEVHRALTRTLSSMPVRLPKRDREYVRRIEASAEGSLSRLAATDQTPEGASRLLAGWATVVRALGRDEFQDPADVSVIHGDLGPQHAFVPVARRGWDRLGLRIIDWERVGWGLPELDLAVLLADANAAQRSHVLETYAGTTQRPLSEVHRRYQWCSLVRSLGEVAALERISRRADAGRVAMALRVAGSSASRALEAAQELDRTAVRPPAA